MKPRPDDFNVRRAHLADMTDEQLKTYFFELTDKLVQPMMDMAKTHTTPAIERSVLMRMGFSSQEAKAITDRLFEYDLLSHGAGHMVYRHAKDNNMSIREAGLDLLEGNAVHKMTEVFKDA